MAKEYDYLLKVLLVGDSDVGKTEILNSFDTEDSEGERISKFKIIAKLNRNKFKFQALTKQQ